MTTPVQPSNIATDLVVPQRGDPPAVFTPQYQTFLDRMHGEVIPSMNTLSAYFNESNAYAAVQVGLAENQVALAAQQVALAENQVSIAADQVALAKGHADDAESEKMQTVAIAASYTDGHQGSHNTFITTRNDGSPLQNGDMFFYSVDKKTYIWSI